MDARFVVRLQIFKIERFSAQKSNVCTNKTIKSVYPTTIYIWRTIGRVQSWTKLDTNSSFTYKFSMYTVFRHDIEYRNKTSYQDQSF